MAPDQSRLRASGGTTVTDHGTEASHMHRGRICQAEAVKFIPTDRKIGRRFARNQTFF
jgi:hypothetical protein